MSISLQLSLFETGKICNTCSKWTPFNNFPKNRSKKDGIENRCKECNREAAARYYHDTQNKAKIKEATKTYRERPENKERKRILAKIAYHTPEIKVKILEREARYAQNPEIKERRRIKAAEKNARTEIKQRNAANGAKWKRENKDAVNAHYNTRRARKAQNGGKYTAQEWKALCALHSHKCLCCKLPLPLVVDHIKPIARGGTSNIGNLQPLCKECNLRKGTREIDYRPQNSVTPVGSIQEPSTRSA